MPERKCEGCKRQIEWGCTAKPHLQMNEDGFPVLDPKTGKQVVNWSNPARIPEIFDDEEVYCCPRQTLRENPREWSWLLMFYAMFKEGFLPQHGAVVDQSNKAIEVMNLMNVVNQECDDELSIRERQKNNRGSSPYGRMG